MIPDPDPILRDPDRRAALAATRLLAGQNRILEMLARGLPRATILAALAAFIEAESDDTLCSILLLDATGTYVCEGVGPSLPAAYMEAIDGEPIGPAAGSCGTAAYTGQPVIVTDIATDPLWAGYRALALQYGLRACWSTPIFSSTGLVLGTFAMYYRQPRAPGPADFERIALATHLASIAIAHTRAADRLVHLARHDALTGLPNRLLLEERLQTALAQSPASALLMLDLDRFKEVNDTLGHSIGDRLLCLVGTRLQETVAAGGLVARLGGDEFAALLPEAAEREARRLARRIARALAPPFDIDGYLLDLRASIGIALAPAHGSDAETLLRRADVAMYSAKRTRRSATVYAPAIDPYSPRRLALISDLRRAIAQDELVLYYQPKVNQHTEGLTGVEALVRWPHPQEGLLGPDAFIPLAEHAGLIRSLSQWVISTALRQCHAWLAAGWTIPVAVNLSMRDLRDPRLPDRLARLLAEWAVAPALLQIEITEGAAMTDPARTLGVLTDLQTLGVQLAVDDFGTGHSSLAHLGRLPVHQLKIDRSFISALLHNRRDALIVRSTIDLGHNLGLTVVAEGVEDQATWNLLAQFGCDESQGYFISRPLPVAAFRRWVMRTAGPSAPLPTPEAAPDSC